MGHCGTREARIQPIMPPSPVTMATNPTCRFNNALTPVYFRRADAFVIVYDVTNTNSFKSTKKWISVIKVRVHLFMSLLQDVCVVGCLA